MGKAASDPFTFGELRGANLSPFAELVAKGWIVEADRTEGYGHLSRPGAQEGAQRRVGAIRSRVLLGSWTSRSSRRGGATRLAARRAIRRDRAR